MVMLPRHTIDRSRVKHTFLIVLLLVAVMVGCTSGLPEGVIYPSIALDETVTYDIPVTVNFTFEGEPVTLDVSVSGALYEGAVNAEKTVTRFGNARENDWIEDYFPAFVEEVHQEPFFDALLAELRRVRDARGLDSDRYVELLTVFTQSLEYKTDPVDLEPKFPVETFVDGNGDCDDKTLLLAGLLSREGYDVAILLFEPEKHVALGVRSAEYDYEGTGYAYTETTAEGFVGMVPDEFAGGIELTSQPRVFGIGAGTTSYTAGGQVWVILEGRQRAIEEAAVLAEQIATADAELQRLEQQIAEMRADLDARRSAGDMAGYNELVPQFNSSVASYNESAERRNKLAERHNRLADVDRIVVEGLDNRVGTYSLVTSSLG